MARLSLTAVIAVLLAAMLAMAVVASPQKSNPSPSPSPAPAAKKDDAKKDDDKSSDSSSSPSPAPAASKGGKNLVFSYYYYQETGVKPWQIPGQQISHLVWSFANIWKDGTITLEGPSNTPAGKLNIKQSTQRTFGHSDTKCNCTGSCLKGELYQMFLLKQQYPHMKLILSVGGWIWSDNFSDAFASSSGRAQAVKSATSLMETYGFDGLDIDWEFPATKKDGNPTFTYRNDDHVNFASFLEEAKYTWNKGGHKDWELTAALTGFVFAGSKDAWARIANALDYGLVMAYEYQHNQDRTWSGGALQAGPGDSADEIKNTVDSGLKSFVASGFPKSKLVMGIPLYGIGWSNIPPSGPFRDNIQGFGYSVKNAATTTPTAYNTLMTQFLRNTKGWTSTNDKARVTNVYYNGSTVWFMDTPDTVKEKAKYAASNGYGGLMLWNSNQDLLDNATSLINAINSVYPVSTSPIRTNKYCMDQSRYCNLHCDYVPAPDTLDNKTLADSGSNGAVVGNGPLIDPLATAEGATPGKLRDFLEANGAQTAAHAGMSTVVAAIVALLGAVLVAMA
ncbi:hypothetical protein GGF32_006747 [Allomyces javanicus]|nr:hypothetical protein GGF32_006747 [Allomyces javanicus]